MAFAVWLTHEPERNDEEDGEKDEAGVPNPDVFIDGRHSQEDEDHGLRAVGHHLQGVAQRHYRFFVHVGIDVLLTADATKGNPIAEKT